MVDEWFCQRTSNALLRPWKSPTQNEKKNRLKCSHHVLQRSTIAPSKNINMFPVQKKVVVEEIHKLGDFSWHVNQHKTGLIEVD